MAYADIAHIKVFLSCIFIIYLIINFGFIKLNMHSYHNAHIIVFSKGTTQNFICITSQKTVHYKCTRKVSTVNEISTPLYVKVSKKSVI